MFNVVVQPGFQKGISLKSIQPRLEKAKFPKSVVKALLNNKQDLIVKKNIPPTEAAKLVTLLKVCGLKASLDLQLNPSCLELGCKRVSTAHPNEQSSTRSGAGHNATSQSQPVPPNKSTKAITYLYNEFCVLPTLFSSTKKADIECDNPRHKFVMERLSYSWNSTLLIALSLIIAYLCEVYVINFLSANLELRTGSTIIGISLLLFIALGLHKLVQPLLCLQITSPSKSTNLLLLEDSSYHIIEKNYTLLNDDNVPEAYIHRTKDEAGLYCQEGEQLYYWSKDSTTDYLNDDDIEGIQEDFVTNNLGDIFESYLYLLKPLIKIFGKKAQIHKLKLDPSNGKPIFNKEQKLVAIVYNGPCLALKLYPGRTDEDHLTLLQCFALSILRPHYG